MVLEAGTGDPAPADRTQTALPPAYSQLSTGWGAQVPRLINRARPAGARASLPTPSAVAGGELPAIPDDSGGFPFETLERRGKESRCHRPPDTPPEPPGLEQELHELQEEESALDVASRRPRKGVGEGKDLRLDQLRDPVLAAFRPPWRGLRPRRGTRRPPTLRRERERAGRQVCAPHGTRPTASGGMLAEPRLLPVQIALSAEPAHERCGSTTARPPRPLRA